MVTTTFPFDLAVVRESVMLEQNKGNDDEPSAHLSLVRRKSILEFVRRINDDLQISRLEQVRHLL